MREGKILWHKYPDEKPPKDGLFSDYTQIWKQERSGDSISDKRHQLKQFDCMGKAS